jgi:anaerobic selenocysteine-containing dehydrogenase
MTAHTTRTVCDPNCIARPRCGIEALVEDGRIISIKPAEFPAQFDIKSRICQMGMSRLEYQYHPDRLTQPLRRVGPRGSGQWEPISWDEAIDLYLAAEKDVTEKYGAQSVLHSQYTGSAGILSRGAGSRYAALTGASVMSLIMGGFDFGVVKGLQYTFGYDAFAFFTRMGHQFSDALNSDLVLLWGANPVVTRSVDYSPLNRARENGTQLVCIDPRKSATAEICNTWLSPAPGTDAALALSILNHVIETDQINHDFVLNHTNSPFLVRMDNGAMLRAGDLQEGAGDALMAWNARTASPVPHSQAETPVLKTRQRVVLKDGASIEVATAFELLCELAAQYPFETAAEICGIPAADISALAVQFAGAKRAAIRAGYGIDHYYYSDVTMRALAALVIVKGHIGKPGTGVMINAGDKLAPFHASLFYAPDGKFPHRAFSLMHADAAVITGDPYPIKMECISFGNPFNQGKPNRRKVIGTYVEKLDFLVVIDHFMTDTARYADLVLPAATIFEKVDVAIDRFVQLQEKAVEPEGQAKSDFDIFKMIAHRRGLGEYFSKTAEAYIEDMLKASPGLGITAYAELAEQKVVSPYTEKTPHICMEDLSFPTPSGRIELYCEDLLRYGVELPYYKEPVEASPKNPLFESYPLILLSPHSKHRIHSTFANMKSIRKPAEPIVSISPADATARSISQGDQVEIVNDRGRVVIRCDIDDRVRPGCVVIEEGYWVSDFVDGDLYSLINDNWSPTALTYVHNDVLVEMRKLPVPAAAGNGATLAA